MMWKKGEYTNHDPDNSAVYRSRPTRVTCLTGCWCDPLIDFSHKDVGIARAEKTAELSVDSESGPTYRVVSKYYLKSMNIHLPGS